MTRELIENIRAIIVPYMAYNLRRINYENMGEIDAKQFSEDMNEILDLATKVLEQQPCEDAISRQAVLDKLNRLIEVERLQGTDEMGYGRERVSAYECMIDAVESEYLYPSIQQKPKTGKWIPDDTICEDTLYRCSNCDNVYYSDYGDVKDMGYNFCPNCGAKMESDGEE